ncbi:related to GS1 protein [Rhynchosporium agropyri]|uniref:Related to GS1 protein n=2 Tax=Rhynchosporium TaxID=38037 RepID=A0A1E1KUR2_9HELO|nr:related to GS1 protein [Rhynchosporium agropyri]CZT06621.1 related to GS1 protein [Rhynchosporium commune]
MNLAKSTDFPPVRACIFDMDGLLINTEVIYLACANELLAKYNRPNLPWSVKAQFMGVPGSSTGGPFYDWAQLPISREQFVAEIKEIQHKRFPECRPLPGVKDLLSHLKKAHNTNGQKIHFAMASSTSKENYDLKAQSPETSELLNMFPQNNRVLAGDPRVKEDRGKPAPDIFLIALQTINEGLPEGEKPIAPAECLVFEDAVPGVEAGRRAKMRVAWVPHPELAAEFREREGDVLAGRIGLVPIGDEWQLGEVGDGWAVRLEGLVNFPYGDYGIRV